MSRGKSATLRERAKVAVLVSGRGSNMAALLYASRADDCPYEIVLVSGDDPQAPALDLASAEGIPVLRVDPAGEVFAQLEAALTQYGAQFVALAGFLKLIPPAVVARWEGRMLNIHPSLLPKHKGLHIHERVIAAGDRHSGCTVHVVTAALDAGPILGQTPVVVLAGDTPETLGARVLIAEHQLFSRCLAAYVTREQSPDYLVQQVRERAAALPESEETLSHGMPCFGIVKGKKFAYVSLDHHGDGKTALLVKISGPDEQAQLIDMDSARYYRPAYFGEGWIGIRLDLGDTDWDAIARWLQRSWQSVAPARLTRLLDAADDF